MTESFLLNLSQEHLQLAKCEVEILFEKDIKWYNHHICRVEGEESSVLKKAMKSGSIRHVFRMIYSTTSPSVKEFEPVIKQFITQAKIETFAVKVLRLDPFTFEEVQTRQLERELGAIILKFRPELRVDLKKPNIKVNILLWEKGIFVANLILQQKGKDYNWKAPKHLPHFRGGAMKPIFARMMVNLVNPAHGEWVIDPFCGHGGLLLELVDIGASPVGIELDGRILRQAQENLRYINYDQQIHLVMGDAFNLPFRKNSITKIVCDPPYAIQTTTSGRNPGQLAKEWLANLKEKVTIVFALPNNLLNNLPKQWKILMEAESYVHKNLTRRVRLITNE